MDFLDNLKACLSSAGIPDGGQRQHRSEFPAGFFSLLFAWFLVVLAVFDLFEDAFAFDLSLETPKRRLERFVFPDFNFRH